MLMADAQTIYTNRWYVPIPLVISSHTKSSGYEGRSFVFVIIRKERKKERKENNTGTL